MLGEPASQRSPKTILKIFAMPRTALNDATIEQLIDRNPALGAKIPERDEEEIEPWEPEEVGRFPGRGGR